ncbi:MAG: T9SS type A sorting domain-containing protein [Chitinivibrionales bacterium]|nr:T9SS type A sorting domain-containing protein [Chitinivibrionales bacterium]MBD3396621.1 T9SS type A sorting domain-containing protein [Chitinivibrionales bacterium]
MSQQTVEILTNRDLIAINQDSLGLQCYPVSGEKGQQQVFVKPLMKGDCAIAFFNPTDGSQSMSVNWSEFDWPENGARVRDLWAGQELGIIEGGYSVTVEAHGTVVLRLSPTSPQQTISSKRHVPRSSRFKATAASFPASGECQISLTDLSGRTVYTAENVHAQHMFRPHSSGVYVLCVTGSNGSFSKRIVIR